MAFGIILTNHVPFLGYHFELFLCNLAVLDFANNSRLNLPDV
jgi:hypothetical protein